MINKLFIIEFEVNFENLYYLIVLKKLLQIELVLIFLIQIYLTNSLPKMEL